MATANSIQAALEQFARTRGMERRGSTWYARGDGVVAITDLQKSQYGPRYYLNQGFWFDALGSNRHPHGAQSHVSIRLEVVAQDRRKEIEELLNLEESIPDDQREERILALLEERLEPILQRGTSVDGIRAMLADGTLKGAAIRGSALDLLSDTGA